VTRADQRWHLMGVPVDPVTMSQAVARCLHLVREAGRPRLVMTPNPEIVVMAQRDGELMDALRQADLLAPDGVGLLWASRKLGCPLPERVAGIDLAGRVLAWAAANDVPVYLLGGRAGVARDAAARLQQRYRGLRIVGWHHGYFSHRESEEICRQVVRSGAKILLVGMGAPRQEKWMVRHRRQLQGVGLIMAVGGSLDVFAGRFRRAPALVRAVGLEWLFRLLQQPWRWRRMLALVRFARLVWGRRVAKC